MIASAPAEAPVDKANLARTYFKFGAQAYEREQYERATLYFENALEYAPGKPQILFSLGQAYRLWYNKEQKGWQLNAAVENFNRFVKDAPDGRNRSLAEKHLALLRPLLAEAQRTDPTSLERPKNSGLAMMSSIPNTVIEVGGDTFEQFPKTLDLEPGVYELKVSAEGFSPTTVSIDIPDGTTVPFVAQLEPLPARLQVVAPEGADIVIDGTLRGKAPLKTLDLDAGDHDVAVLQTGHYAFSKSVSVGRGEEQMVKAELEGTSQRTFAWVLGGTAVLLTVTSGLVALGAVGRQAQAQELEMQFLAGGLNEAQVATYQNHEQARDRLRAGAGVALGGAVVTGAISALLFAFDSPRPPGGKLLPIAWVGEGGGGVAATMDF